MLKKARELADHHGWFLTEQFRNEANANIHSQTTAQEIVDDFEQIGLDYWVTGFGTGGTLKGVSRVLKERSPKTKVATFVLGLRSFSTRETPLSVPPVPKPVTQ